MPGIEIDSSMLINVAGYLIAGLLIVFQWLKSNRNTTEKFEAKIDALSKEYGISKRELDVLKLELDGNTSKQIGSILFIAESTVKVHRQNIRKKLNISTTGELQKLVRETKVK